MVRELERLKRTCEDRVEGNRGCTGDEWRLTAGLGDTGSSLWPGHVGTRCEVLGGGAGDGGVGGVRGNYLSLEVSGQAPQ